MFKVISTADEYKNEKNILNKIFFCLSFISMLLCIPPHQPEKIDHKGFLRNKYNQNILSKLAPAVIM